MKVRIYMWQGRSYTLQGVVRSEAILRPWPWSDAGEVEFAPMGELQEGAEVEVGAEKPNYQPTTKQLPGNYQSTTSQLPRSGQPTTTRGVANYQPRGLDLAPDWDPVAHYVAHYHVVRAMLMPEVWADSKLYSTPAELVAHGAVLPRPVQRRLNKVLHRSHSRDFYTKLLHVHAEVEAARPWRVVEALERVALRFMYYITGEEAPIYL